MQAHFMKGKTPDRRVQRTHRLLHQALMSLIVEKKYESITVREVLDRADVGRSTFYTHFQDKDELLVSGFQYFKNLLAPAQASSAIAGNSYERIIGFSIAIFEHASEYRRVIRALLDSNAESVLRRHLHSAVAAAIHPEVKKEFQSRAPGNCAVSPELLTHFLVSTYVSVLIWWLNSKNPVPPRSGDAAYRQLVLPCLASILGEPNAVRRAAKMSHPRR